MKVPAQLAADKRVSLSDDSGDDMESIEDGASDNIENKEDEIKKPPKPKIPKKSFLDDLTDRLKDFLDNAE